MNRNQWFVFAGVFFLIFLFFINDATMQATSAASELLTSGTTTYWQTQTIRSAIYGSFAVVSFGLFLAFLISGFLEILSNRAN